MGARLGSQLGSLLQLSRLIELHQGRASGFRLVDQNAEVVVAEALRSLELGDDGADRVATAAPGSETAAVAVMVPPPSLGARWDLFARVASPADNMGITWAVADADNYWEVRLATSNAAIVVNRVTDGQPQQLGLYGPAGVNPGDALHIQRVGDQVIVAVDDHILGSWAHPELADLRRAGVFAGSGGQGGFGSVLVTGDG